MLFYLQIFKAIFEIQISDKMARTESTMLPLGTIAPDFYLKDTNSNDTFSFEDLKGSKGTLVLFICNHCPFVHHVINEIVMIANDYRVQGLGVIAISSNDIVKYPEDSPELMTDFALENKIEWREDSSNASDKYLRNKLRHDIVPILKSLNPSFLGSFQDTLKHLEQAKSLTEDASILVYKQVVTENENQKLFRLFGNYVNGGSLRKVE